ncbi:hypothetical protein KIH74_25220 [Kineosporia sp. J2-2]|uniref:2-polyprenyl-6-methoxyphenol hydroxylase-like FAD-dependent oxidoreductase n=1 Tax=Kineosporia corallincola TaxID=2835133 RepID=A0ABS5TQ11_9ACTN|nr:hypothetical protein [Kineosporia corallincola]MBT0772271.1 hypothetical protein [Kineosporia corallincola]
MTTAASTFHAITSAGPPVTPPAKSLGTAVVLGGSIAGLLAARVLADHAATVLVMERDELPEGGVPRKGVPQGGQAHVLLAAGGGFLERWFPGFTDRAIEAGACLVTTDRVAVYDDGVPRVNGADVRRLALTRPFLEDLVRAELRAVPNVKSLTGRVTGLEFGDTAVTAVTYESAGVSGVEPADLVVDAMGRASRVSDWLEEAGWDRPPMVRVISGVNYATAFFRRPPGTPGVGLAMNLTGSKYGGAASGAIAMAVENDRFIVVQGGYGDFRPGSTAADMVARCRTEHPEPFGRAVEGEMLGEVATFRQADSRRRDFCSCERLPARLVPVGDAVASFNPLYAQGISSASLHAGALSLFLRSEPDLDVPARAFLDLQRVVVDAAWSISTTGDAAAAAGAGTRTLAQRVSGWLVARVVAASMTDAPVNRVFVEVTQMLRHPSELARPGILLRSLLAARHRRPDPVPPLVREP